MPKQQQQQQKRKKPEKLRTLQADADGNVLLNMRGSRSVFPLQFLRQPSRHELLEQLEAAPCTECPNGEYFYDADHEIFQLLLRCYGNSMEMHLPSHLCGPLLERELDFWQLEVAAENLQSCCMHWAMDSKRWKLTLNEFEDKALTPPADDSLLWPRLGGEDSACRRAWRCLTDPVSSLPAGAYGLAMIGSSVAAAYLHAADPPHFCSDWLATDDQRRSCDNATSVFVGGVGDVGTPPPATAHSADEIVVLLQFLFALLFTADLGLRALLAPSKKKFLCSPFTWNDAVSLLPLYATLLLRAYHFRLHADSTAAFFLELLVVPICFRVVRVVRRFYGMRVLAYTLGTGRRDLMALFVLLLVASSMFGTVFYFVEGRRNANVANIFVAIYWALITMTTVGYGDISPATIEGRVIAAACSMCGLLVVAFTVPLLSDNFMRFYSHMDTLQVTKKENRLFRRLGRLRKCVVGGGSGGGSGKRSEAA